ILGSPVEKTQAAQDYCPYSVAKESSTVYRFVANYKYVKSEEVSGPQEVEVRKDHLARYNSVEFGKATYFAGGIVTRYDGIRHDELGFINPPAFNAKREGAGTGSWANGGGPNAINWVGAQAYYTVVYELVSASGELMISEVSDTMPVTITANTDTVILTLEPATITRRYWNASYNETSPRVIVSIYRSALPNDPEVQRLFTFDSPIYTRLVSDPEALDPIFLHDYGSNDSGNGKCHMGSTPEVTAYPYYNVETHEFLYTNSGELENNLPYGGATAICVHKDRLWLGGGDDPEIIWYSKELAQSSDRCAEFSNNQQIRIAGERVVALESAGDYIVAFCEGGIYVISGDGPNITGDPSSGTFSIPFQISPIGCTQPRSVAYVPMGLMYRSVRGIHLVNFERTVVWIGQPVQNTVDDYPDVLSVLVVPEKTQIRFSIANTARTDGRTLVYDWEEDRWAVWSYTGFFVADSLEWGDKLAILDTSGNLYAENRSSFADDNRGYGMYLETGWISFGRLQGFKKIRKFGMLLEKLDTHGLTVTMDYNYGGNLTAVKTFSVSEISTINAPEWLRITSPYQKQPSIKLKIAEVPDPNNLATAGFVLKSIAFEIGMIAGLSRVSAKQSK
ncbi:MAG: hypothetical protein KGL39_39225, partial [Patescibacteria group bacterium]|nr:hypothetical protein [Patescibacteria group bacterium]